MGKRIVTLIYYKETGKYLTTSSYISDVSPFDIPTEVRIKRNNKDLPGIETEELWFGYCVIDPEGGVRQLLDFTKE